MRQPPVRRHTMQGLLALLLAWACLQVTPVWAQNVELPTVRTSRGEGTLDLEFAVRLSLPRAVEDALHRGVPVYFVAEAQLLRNRWYWRDERVARVQRTWRVAYQPLTGNWRVGLGDQRNILQTGQTHLLLVQFEQVPASQDDLALYGAGGRLQQAHDSQGQGGLATTRLAQNYSQLGLFNIEINILKYRYALIWIT